jgi:hypothetical protein
VEASLSALKYTTTAQEGDMTIDAIPHPTLYFGYGSNLWIDQMNRRCPESKLVGVGLLKDWCA